MIQADQFIDRHRYIGGSDVPIIMGQNKFSTAWELLLEKAQIRPKVFGGNIYTAVGNLLEPRIQKVCQIKNVDEITYEREYQGVPFACHIDGLNHDESQIQEIKVVNQTLQDCYQAYEWQIRTYMYVLGIDKARLIMLRRDGQLQKLVQQIIAAYDLGPIHDFNDFDQETVEAALKSLERGLNQLQFSTKMLKSCSLEHSEEACIFMLKKVRRFWDFKERLESDPNLHADPDFRQEFEQAMR